MELPQGVFEGRTRHRGQDALERLRRRRGRGLGGGDPVARQAHVVASPVRGIGDLRGATVLTARTFGLDDRGTIEPGRRADLLLVDGDPTTDITATRNIAGVWINGERIR